MAGTITVTRTGVLGNRVEEISVAWVSNASGAVSGLPISVGEGRVLQVKAVPNASGTQPTDLYDLTILDSDSVDILGGEGADLSNSAGTYLSTTTPVIVRGEQLSVTIANAGNAKGGTVKIWVEGD